MSKEKYPRDEVIYGVTFVTTRCETCARITPHAETAVTVYTILDTTIGRPSLSYTCQVCWSVKVR